MFRTTKLAHLCRLSTLLSALTNRDSNLYERALPEGITGDRRRSWRESSIETTARILALGLLGLFVASVRASASGVPQFGHVVIVLGENAGLSQTYQTGAMPYLDSLAAKYGLATNYVADTHGSIADYFLLSSGQILSTNGSLTPSSQMFSVDNIALDVQNAGKTWKDYVENLNSSCGGLHSGVYEASHDPLAFFSNINQANRVCFSQFATDVANKALPNFSWLVPNECDDGDGCGASTFDNWLKTEIAPLLSSSYFQPGGDGLLIIPFDENQNLSAPGCTITQIETGTWCGGQVETVIVTPLIVSAGFQSTNGYHHENVLRLMEEALGLKNFPGASSDPAEALSPPIDMADFFTANSGSGSGAGPSVVQVENNIDTSTTSHVSFSVNIATTPGDLLVAFARESTSATDNFTVTDSAGQLWTQTSSGYLSEGSSGPRLAMFYVANSEAVTSVTVHYTTSGGVTKPGIMVMEISGAAISGVTNGSAANRSASDTTTSTSGSLATSNADDILIFATDVAGNQTGWSAGSGYAIPNNNATTGASGSNARMAMQFALVSSTQSSATTSMTYNSAAWNGSIFAAFKLTSSAGSSSSASLSPSSLTFASQPVETTSPAQTVTLANTGTQTLNITSIGIAGSNSGDFGQSNNCGSSVAAGAHCTISVTFTPTATGTRTAELAVTDNASGSPQTVSLTGTGATGSASGPALVQVQNNVDTSGTAFTSLSVKITTKTGDLLVAFCRAGATATDNFTVTDSAGQTWAQTASGYMNESSTGPRIGMFYVANSLPVTSVTVHFKTSGGVIKPGIMVMEISGAASSGVPDGSVNGGTASDVTTSASGSLTTMNPNDILIFATDAAGNQTGWTAGTGYAIPNNKLTTGASGSNVRMAMQYAVVSSTQTDTRTSMTYQGSDWNGNIFAAFK